MKTFRNTVQAGRLALTAELALTRASGAGEIRRQADLLGPLVDAVQVTDSPLAWVQPSAVAASALLLQHGVDCMPILSCRDRNRLGLLSDLLGLRALGVSSLVLTRGRRVGKKNQLHASTVFDLTARELISMANGLNEEEGQSPASQFLIGTGARAFHPKRDWQAESLTERADAGARFLQTQIVMNVDILRAWMKRLVEAKATWRYSVVVTVAPLPSAETARWVKTNMSDSKVPLKLIERLEKAADPEAEGVAICAETMRQIAEVPGVSGINVLSTGDVALSAAAIRASGLAK
jgi:methylenetetrahydrofolate reductase (NADPH)